MTAAAKQAETAADIADPEQSRSRRISRAALVFSGQQEQAAADLACVGLLETEPRLRDDRAI
jgi:hypothetical protein